MAIVRFLDKTNNCYQVNAPDQPLMIYLNKDEKKMLQESKDGECLYLFDSSVSEVVTEVQKECLKTTEKPRMMQ